ncbi:hypothetical protein OSCI_2210014 [Kamptonema sp. PCC 6506]|nr:hypothetical protein OSCI_2210014 [Kamptonema sp. PCC 6506]
MYSTELLLFFDSSESKDAVIVEDKLFEIDPQKVLFSTLLSNDIYSLTQLGLRL